MHKTSRKIYVLLAVWACMVAFGIGVELSHAAALDGQCGSICNEECGGREECAYIWYEGCDCHYICESGEEGVEWCTE